MRTRTTEASGVQTGYVGGRVSGFHWVGSVRGFRIPFDFGLGPGDQFRSHFAGGEGLLRGRELTACTGLAVLLQSTLSPNSHGSP